MNHPIQVHRVENYTQPCIVCHINVSTPAVKIHFNTLPPMSIALCGHHAAYLADALRIKLGIDNWISVKDRLPDKDVEVIGYCDSKYRDEGYQIFCIRDERGWCYDHDEYGRTDLDVTHWMPKPPPPRKEP